MDLQFWIYVIVVVAMVVSRMLRKPAKGPDNSEPQTDNDRDTGSKPMSFEELLREIQESKTPRQPATIQQKTQSAPPIKSYEKPYEVDYDEQIEEEEKSYETIQAKPDNRSYEIYEKAKNEAFSRPSLEDTLKLKDTVLNFDHFKEYNDNTRPSMVKEILNDFKDPEGFKKAFIMSEILKRKF